MTGLPRWSCWPALAALAVALLLCTVPATVAADDNVASFGLLPTTSDPAIPETKSYFVFNGQPNAVIKSEVKVVNAGKAAGTVRLYAVDGTTSNTTGTVFYAETDARQDVGSWIAIDPGSEELTLGPNESRVVSFTVTVPKEPRPGQHVGGLVAENKELSKTDAGSNTQLSVRSRTILAVQLNLPGATVEKITATSVVPGGSQGFQSVVLDLRNDGTAMVKPIGTLRVRNGGGQLVQDLPLKMDTFLPQTAIKYPVLIQNQALDAGDYEATLDLTYGEKGETHYTTRFSISKELIEQTFANAQPLQAPGTVRQPGATAGNATAQPSQTVAQPATAAQPSFAAAPTKAAGTSASWLPIVAAAGGGMLFVLLLGGVFMLGRRRSS